ncbi:cupin domain-containing protein [Leucobacter sp. CSA1]|uniref:Cupin domain-containing protein n=2 Tax=Microbacteriaceae TaxID=85023 RepID=A0A934UWU5_9MICO|nr:cupin domain-containing protein [Leucobacter chromiisoli]MBK0420272.1 cupin domain-containing protein [Leucobacter chromiisoli]MCD1572350.1 cupin domain-containing protein [Agromyces mediolanus]
MHQFQSTSGALREVEYSEVLRVPAMSVGTYYLPVGAIDPQGPHTEDEIYVILEGRGILRTESGDGLAVPGAALFVPAGERHSFTAITESLFMYVIFSPAEGTNARAEK